jgi:glycolate oxidase iron-sulfur subunit
MTTAGREIAEALLRCNKCGFCLAHCPIYKVTGVEWTGARGRIALIRSALLDNHLDVKELDAPVFNCLTCNACVDDCPAGVQTADIIFSAREELYKQRGDSWMSRLVFRRLLASPSLLHRASGILRLADVSGLRTAARKTGLVKLMGDAGRAEAMVPPVPPVRGVKAIVHLFKRLEHPKYKVAYFVGCYASNLGHGEAAATLRILHRHQVEVSIPEFVCCGIPAPAYGDMSSAQSLAKKNIAVAGKMKIDAIVTHCASCSSFLKDYGKLLADEPEWAEKARNFSARIKDLNEFLIDIGLVSATGAIREKVTYHDPCHLVRYQKIKQQPRTIIRSIPGVDFMEMKEADMCCGAAGTYGFKNYELSMKVLARKMENIEKTGAGIVVSSCPACIMQISAGVRERKMSVHTLSIAELLDRAYRTAESVH